MTQQPGVYVPLRALFLVVFLFFSLRESFMFQPHILFSVDLELKWPQEGHWVKSRTS